MNRELDEKNDDIFNNTPSFLTFGIRKILEYEKFWNTKNSGIRKILECEKFWNTENSGIQRLMIRTTIVNLFKI